VLISGRLLALLPINVRKSLVPGKRAAAAFKSDTSNLSTFLVTRKKVNTPEYSQNYKIRKLW